MRKLVAILFLLAITPSFVFAQLNLQDTGLIVTGGQAYDQGTAQSPGQFIGQHLVTPVFELTGVIVLLMIVYGGVLWMTSIGDPGKVKKAQGILTNSIIGAIVIASAYGITTFLFSSFG